MSDPHTSTHIHVERHDDGVAVIRLDRPKVNALSTALLQELRGALRTLHEDPPGAVVVTGGDRIFAAGADIAEFAGPAEAREIAGVIHETLDALAALPRVVIAEIAGPALGGGLELALACDLRVAADTAVLGLPEILLGIIPGGGGTQRLTRLVGPARAKSMVLSGRQVPAPEAAAIGLVDEVVPADQLATRVREIAAQYASGALVAQGLAKDAIDAGMSLPLSDALALEQDRFVDAFGTEDARIGIASFLEHGPGKARFTGR